MKKTILKVLQERLDRVNIDIAEYQNSFKRSPTPQSHTYFKVMIADYQQQKVEIEQAINWLKTL
jgi:hypothetical protein